MVSTVRQGTINCTSPGIPSGMFVVGEPNALDHAIPRLPLLIPSDDENTRFMVKDFYSTTESSSQKIYAPDLISSFQSGDIVWLDALRGVIRTVLSGRSNANTLLVTEQCNNRCVFCSQPPNELPDTQLYLNAATALVNYFGHDFVGISGGEPTLNRDAFLRLLHMVQTYRVPTPLHVLTNGRGFASTSFTGNVVEAVEGRTVLWGVPLYSHAAAKHDDLVAAEGAFEETVKGLLQLGAAKQAVELRIIPTLPNYRQLHHAVQFVCSVLPFVHTISIMNLEPKGWGRKNYESLYVSVRTQSPYLAQTVSIATDAGIDISLFNYPLCLLDAELCPYASKTISDWKNYYPPECDSCILQHECGGFFSSAQGRFIEKVEPVL